MLWGLFDCLVGVVQYEAAIELPTDFYTLDNSRKRQAEDDASRVDQLIEQVNFMM